MRAKRNRNAFACQKKRATSGLRLRSRPFRRTFLRLGLALMVAGSAGWPTYVSASGNSQGATFSPNAHRAALLKLLDTFTAPHRINRLTLLPSPVDHTWVLYYMAIPVSNPSSPGKTEEDQGEGFAHFINGRWVNVVGPGSGFCLTPNGLPGVPSRIFKSYKTTC